MAMLWVSSSPSCDAGLCGTRRNSFGRLWMVDACDSRRLPAPNSTKRRPSRDIQNPFACMHTTLQPPRPVGGLYAHQPSGSHSPGAQKPQPLPRQNPKKPTGRADDFVSVACELRKVSDGEQRPASRENQLEASGQSMHICT